MSEDILFSSSWDFILSRDGKGQLIFAVLCGSVGVYDITFPLNSEEVAHWEREGETFLRYLSDRVRNNSEEYLARQNSSSV